MDSAARPAPDPTARGLGFVLMRSRSEQSSRVKSRVSPRAIMSQNWVAILAGKFRPRLWMTSINLSRLITCGAHGGASRSGAPVARWGRPRRTSACVKSRLPTRIVARTVEMARRVLPLLYPTALRSLRSTTSKRNSSLISSMSGAVVAFLVSSSLMRE